MASTCGTCWSTFPAGWRSRQQHLDSTGHDEPDFECNTCNRYFQSQRAVEQHMDACDHWGTPTQSPTQYLECDMCYDTFENEQDLKSHEVDAHLFCSACDRTFINANCINQHLRSKIHNNSSITCPFCSKVCNTATGLVHHIERGACPKAPLDREKLYHAVRSRDPTGLISKKLLTGPANSTYEATGRTWNPRTKAYECYFCHRPFQTLVALNQHLQSPIHQQALYHCPNRGCAKDFKTLAAVINHLESESCAYMSFQTMQQTTQRLFDRGRMIEI